MPRELDAFSKGQMREDGVLKAAAPECKGQPGWVYNKGWVISEDIFNLVPSSKRWTKSLFLLYHFTLESWKIFFVHFSPSKLRMQSEIEPPLKPTSQNRYVPLLCVHLTYLPNWAIQQIKYNFPIHQKISGLIKVH